LAPLERPGITGPRLFSRRQAAAYLSVSIDQIDRWASRGVLPRLRLPGAPRLVRFDRMDLDNLVESLR
jgi:excisionase family DNA binding protein